MELPGESVQGGHIQLEPLILLVEDSEDDAFFLERALIKTGLGCRRLHVSDGGQAIEFLRAHNGRWTADTPMVVLLDLKMPVLSGFEVLRWVQASGDSDHLDVVVLSGSNQHSDVEAARKLGASGYLIKPARVEELKTCLIPRIERWRQRFLHSLYDAGPVHAFTG